MIKNTLRKLLLLISIIFFSSNIFASDNNMPEAEKITTPSQEQTDVQKIISEHKYSVKVSGFFCTRYRWDDLPSSTPGFDMRFARLTLTGNLTPDFSYKFQSEFAGTVRILDLMVAWNKYEFFNVTVGQQKRNFTFENYLAPFAITVNDYSQNVLNLGGFFDRVGEHASGGRDVGITVGGEFYKYGDHNLFKYALGVFNGEGINKSDKNKGKDLIGSVFIQPIKDLFIGGGYWDGDFGPDSAAVDRKRWTVGVSYKSNGYIARSEYIASRGGTLGKDNIPLKSDGWYAVAEVPVYKKFGVGAKYDLYRDDRTMSNSITKYYAAVNWYMNKYIIMQGAYCFTNDRMNSRDYSGLTFQLFVRY